MERHIIEILVLIIKEHPEGMISLDEFSALNESLDEMGYTQQEIDMALFWYHNHLMVKDDNNEDQFGTGSIRVLHDIERSIISTEAYGYLLELNQLGLIDVSEMDSIIDKSVILGGRNVSIDDIKIFVAAQIMDQDESIGTHGISQYIKIPSSLIQ